MFRTCNKIAGLLSKCENLEAACRQQVARIASAATNSRDIFNHELDDIREAGTWKPERVIVSKQGPTINVEGNTNNILNFCANNYLGLSSHPYVIEAGKKAFDTHGAGLSSSRIVCGTMDIHLALEEKLAKFHHKEDCLLYISCYDANAGFFEVMLTSDDAVISDELNHASIIDGIRLCKAKRYRYKHMVMAELEEQLKETQSCRQRLVVTDGVFSMDGNVTPLSDIVDLATKYKAMVLVDDCHATGFYGDTGRGTEEHFHLDLHKHSCIINSTLGKAMGGASGGYTAGPHELISLLRQRSRPYIFSNSIPPPVVACASAALDIIMASPELPHKVLTNTHKFRGRMTEAGFNLSGDWDHPICPVMLGDARMAAIFADEMLELSAAHTESEIDRAVDAFVDIGRKLNIIN